MDKFQVWPYNRICKPGFKFANVVLKIEIHLIKKTDHYCYLNFIPICPQCFFLFCAIFQQHWPNTCFTVLPVFCIFLLNFQFYYDLHFLARKYCNHKTSNWRKLQFFGHFGDSLNLQIGQNLIYSGNTAYNNHPNTAVKYDQGNSTDFRNTSNKVGHFWRGTQENFNLIFPTSFFILCVLH